MNNRKLYLNLFCLILITPSAHAELAIGVGAAAFQDPQKGMNAKNIVMPLISYRGERLNFQVTTLSYRIARLGDLDINVLASGRIQGYEAEDSAYLRGMKTRSNTLDGGISLDWNGFSLSYQHDLLSKYQGDAISLAYNKGFELGRLQLMTGAGLTWQSEKLNQYYFGVEATEAQNLTINHQVFQRTQYQAGAALVPKINVLGIYSLSTSWSLIGGAEVEFLPNDITDSPIVGEKTSWGAFVGLVRNF